MNLPKEGDPVICSACLRTVGKFTRDIFEGDLMDLKEQTDLGDPGQCPNCKAEFWGPASLLIGGAE